jgi:thiamine pyrophosphate-dependent acetolactate synthase large subunit-like protein
MKVARAVGEALADAGVAHVFGLVGSGNFRVTQALKACGARFISSRHETSAVTAADGYATVTGRPGVVTVHQGPGYTNALTGMVEAAKSRSPVLLVAADTPDAWIHSNFRVGQAAMAEAGGIALVRPTTPDAVPDALARAWQLVAGERRATALLLPLDVGEAELDGPLPAIPAARPPAAPAPEAAAVERVADLAQRAKRPVVIAGRGAVLSRARAEIEEVAERIGAPLATTAVANGLFAGNPWSLGISGGFATPLAAEVIATADLLVAFGASLTRWTTKHGRLIGAETAIVQVDNDPAAIGVHHPVEIGLVADVRAAAEALGRALEARLPGQRTPELEARIRDGGWHERPFEDASTSETIDPRTLTLALDELLPLERTVVVDGGHFSGWPAMYLRVPDATGFVFHQAFQSIGLGLGTAIGAAVGRPDRLTLAAVGDGCTYMALGELETATRIGEPLVVLVYDDDAYGAEIHHFAGEDVPLDIVRFPARDLAGVARALGAEGVTIRRRDDLSTVRAWLAGDRDHPLVIDARVTPSVVGAWLPEAFGA